MTGKYRIRERREELGLSQADLAEAIGTNQRQISAYETGKNDPTGRVWEKLADTLDTSVDYLLGRTVNPERPLRNEFDLTDIEREAIKVLRSKKPEDRKRFVDIMRLLGDM